MPAPTEGSGMAALSLAESFLPYLLQGCNPLRGVHPCGACIPVDKLTGDYSSAGFSASGFAVTPCR